MQNDTRQFPTLAILAGGEGSRMGKPKGLLQIGDTPILSYLLAKINWPGPTLLITAPGKEHPPGAEQFDHEAVDPISNQGPLRGIHTALEHSTTEITIVTTVDMPGVNIDVLNWVADQLQSHPKCACVLLSRLIDGQQQIEPFPSAYRKTTLPIIAARLDRNERSVHRLSLESNVQILSVPDQWPDSTWMNLNSPSDFEKWRASIANT